MQHDFKAALAAFRYAEHMMGAKVDGDQIAVGAVVYAVEKLIRADEREACAELCDVKSDRLEGMVGGASKTLQVLKFRAAECRSLAASIRARGDSNEQ